MECFSVEWDPVEVHREGSMVVQLLTPYNMLTRMALNKASIVTPKMLDTIIKL